MATFHFWKLSTTWPWLLKPHTSAHFENHGISICRSRSVVLEPQKRGRRLEWTFASSSLLPSASFALIPWEVKWLLCPFITAGCATCLLDDPAERWSSLSPGWHLNGASSARFLAFGFVWEKKVRWAVGPTKNSRILVHRCERQGFQSKALSVASFGNVFCAPVREHVQEKCTSAVCACEDLTSFLTRRTGPNCGQLSISKCEHEVCCEKEKSVLPKREFCAVSHASSKGGRSFNKGLLGFRNFPGSAPVCVCVWLCCATAENITRLRKRPCFSSTTICRRWLHFWKKETFHR